MRSLIAIGLVLAICAGGCFSTSATGRHHHPHSGGTTTGGKKKQDPQQQQSPPGTNGTTGGESQADRQKRKAEMWHQIILLRRHIEQVRESALRIDPRRSRRLRSRYPEFQTKSTNRLDHILTRWQERLAKWQGT